MNAPAAATAVLAGAPAAAGKWHAVRIEWLRHWTPVLRSFRIPRPAGFRFVPGHYARLGLDDGTGKPVWRPFSMVSGPEEDFLEFVVVLVPGGEFSERLRQRQAGDEILVEKLSLGFLTLDQLAPGRDLWLLASGTGIGPFVSLLRDGRTWRSFERLVLAHSVRRGDELAYGEEIAALPGARDGRLRYLPVVTRETLPGALNARLPQLFAGGELQRAAGLEIDVARSRVMVCGNPELTREMRALLAARGFQPGRRGVPGQMAFEKYW